METRSSRYLDEDVSTRPKLTRANKNRYLYDEVNNKIGYEEIDTLEMYDGIELDCDSPIKTREEYQKMKDTTRLEKDVVDVNREFEEEAKVYDINSILEEAKKNRVIPDELEKKRKLQNVEYSILNDLNQKYINKKEKIEEDLEKEGIRELIDTITSRNLASDLADLEKDDNDEDDESDLMSDLLATNTMNAIEGISLEEDIAKEILVDKRETEVDEEESDEVVEEDGCLVNSFYTRSMDLSEHDFEIRDEIIEDNKEKRKILILVILIILVIIAIVSIFILKKINVI